MLFIAIVTCYSYTNFSIIYTLCSIITILDLLMFMDCDFASMLMFKGIVILLPC